MQPGTYAPPPPPVVPSEQVTPSKWWFLTAGLIAVAGIVLAVIWFVVGLMRFFDTIEDFQRVDVPGTSEIDIDDPGGYSVYHEYSGASGDDGFGRFVSDPSITITDPSGNDVPLDPYSSSVTYSGSGHEGVAVSTFDADEAGTYTVETQGDSGSEVAIGPGIGSGLVATIVGGFAIGGAGVLAGGIMAIVVGVRRSQNRRSLMGPVPPPGPPGGWGAYPSYGPPPGYGGYPPAPSGPGYGGYGGPGGGQPQGPPSGPGFGAPAGGGYAPPPAPGYGVPSAPGYGRPPAGPSGTGLPPSGPPTAGPPSSGPRDAGPPPTGPSTAGPAPTGPSTAGPAPTGPRDAGPSPQDAEPEDAPPRDTPPPEAPRP
jgi:hypothetical protein